MFTLGSLPSQFQMPWKSTMERRQSRNEAISTPFLVPLSHKNLPQNHTLGLVSGRTLDRHRRVPSAKQRQKSKISEGRLQRRVRWAPSVVETEVHLKVRPLLIFNPRNCLPLFSRNLYSKLYLLTRSKLIYRKFLESRVQLILSLETIQSRNPKTSWTYMKF